MTTRTDFDGLLRDHLRATAEPLGRDGQLDAIVARTASTRPRASWLARMRAPDRGLDSAAAPMSTVDLGWVVLIAALGLIVAGILVVGGGGRRDAVVAVPYGSPSARPSAPSSPSPTPSSSPSSSVESPRPPMPGVGTLAYVKTPVGPWSPGISDLFLADANGANAHVLVSGIDGGGDWSTSGRYLTVVHSNPDTTGSIDIIEPDGTSVGRIDGIENADMRWSPVADDLAVVSDAAAGARLEIYHADGSLLRRLTLPATVTFIDGWGWSPDATHLVISGRVPLGRNPEPFTEDLWVLDARTSTALQLTRTTNVIEVGPTWSPDGSLIAYWVGCSVQVDCQPETWLIKPDGTGRRRLTTGTASGLASPWSPDGSNILVARYSPGPSSADSGDLWFVERDATHETRLTTELGEDEGVSWDRSGNWVMVGHVAPTGGDQLADPHWELRALELSTDRQVVLSTASSTGEWRPTP